MKDWWGKVIYEYLAGKCTQRWDGSIEYRVKDKNRIDLMVKAHIAYFLEYGLK